MFKVQKLKVKSSELKVENLTFEVKRSKIISRCLLASFLLLLACSKKETSPQITFPTAYVVNGGDNTVSVLDLKQQSVQATWQFAETGWGHHIYASRDGEKIAIATPQYDFSQGHDASHTASNQKGGIVVLDALNGKILQRFDVPNINHNVVFTNDGKEIWTSLVSHTGRIMVYDVEKGVLIKTITVDADPSEIVIPKNSPYAFVACGESSFVTAIDLTSKQIVRNIKVDKFPTNVWASSDGKVYVENKNQRSINIINPQTLIATEVFDLTFVPAMVEYSEKNNEIWICEAKNEFVHIFERKNNAWVWQSKIQTGTDAHAIQFSADGSQAFVVNQGNNTVSVINVQQKTKIKDITVGKQPNGIAIR